MTATLTLTGRSIIGHALGEETGVTSHGVNPATGEKLDPPYHGATEAEVDKAARLAHEAFGTYGRLPGRDKAAFLRKIAEKIAAIGDPLVERMTRETALPEGRVKMETGRTCNQLRLFADLLEEGSWVEARIDRADPDRKPMPKPDVRSMMRPLGPVVVFGASNFPLAFSVAGGDTASALAAGCPVIVKAHHAHPGTAELVGQAVQEAARECGMPEGVFSLIFGSGREVGTALVRHPLVKAVGFTGSRAGGRALMDLAAARPEPIPVYTEMSSINPVFILPGAMKERGEQLAAAFQGSIVMGVGQFCTNPGLIFVDRSAESEAFVAKLGELMAAAPEATMLTSGIRESYGRGTNRLNGANGVEAVAFNDADAGAGGCQAGTGVFRTDAKAFLSDEALRDEVFGPTTLVVTHDSREQALDAARSLEGQLTATIHGTEDDLKEFAELIAILETKAGRLLFNGIPTGVEVCHAMVHGGPYPATSDGRSTSVGTQAIYRFARLVAYQGFPDAALPDALKEGNPLGVWRLVDGETTR